MFEKIEMKIGSGLLLSLAVAQDCDLSADKRQYDLYGCVVKRIVASQVLFFCEISVIYLRLLRNI